MRCLPRKLVCKPFTDVNCLHLLLQAGKGLCTTFTCPCFFALLNAFVLLLPHPQISAINEYKLIITDWFKKYDQNDRNYNNPEWSYESHTWALDVLCIAASKPILVSPPYILNFECVKIANGKHSENQNNDAKKVLSSTVRVHHGEQSLKHADTFRCDEMIWSFQQTLVISLEKLTETLASVHLGPTVNLLLWYKNGKKNSATLNMLWQSYIRTGVVRNVHVVSKRRLVMSVVSC